MVSSLVQSKSSRGGLRLSPSQQDPQSLEKYSALFRICFPGAAIADVAYLSWLYTQNPAAGVVGFDAWDEQTLAAHYVCIPVDVRLGGNLTRCLLSLNTATHPAYQGQGLFTRLAAATYDQAQADGYAAVYGVANANSTPGFLRKLGFQLVAPLAAKLGVGRVGRAEGWDEVAQQALFRRVWTPESLAWRVSNPLNAVAAKPLGAGCWGFDASARRFGLRAYAETWVDPDVALVQPPRARLECGGRLFLGLLPDTIARYRGYVEIPQALKPSPLNMIYRPLASSAPERLDDAQTMMTFMDFDAF